MAIRVTQSVVEAAFTTSPNLRVTQSIVEAAVSIGVDCNNPPGGRLYLPYSHGFVAGGGDAPYTFSISAGALPPGLTLNAATGAVSGTPTASGTFAFTVAVADSIDSVASVSCSITILALAIIGPSGGGGGFRPSTCGCSPAVLAAERLRRLSVRRRAYPYNYVFPDAVAVPVELLATVAAPVVGSTAVVLAYTVPEGFSLVLQSVMQDYAGGVFVAGDAVWTVDVNTPVGVANVQAMPVQGLTAVPVPLGSVDSGSPWPFSRPYKFSSLTLLQSKVRNVNLGAGSFTSGFFGYLVADVPK